MKISDWIRVFIFSVAMNGAIDQYPRNSLIGGICIGIAAMAIFYKDDK